MKWTEIRLRARQIFCFGSGETMALDRCELQGRNDGLRVWLDPSSHLDLPSAVDIGERLEYARVFAIEGDDPSHVLLLGGVNAYCLSNQCKVVDQFELYRKHGEEEYWSTTIVDK